MDLVGSSAILVALEEIGSLVSGHPSHRMILKEENLGQWYRWEHFDSQVSLAIKDNRSSIMEA